MEGNLAQIPVTELLRELYARGDSGVLAVSNGAVTKRVFFKRGAIVFASSSEAAERLGERLVRAGRLKRRELDLACRVRESSPLRLGRTLVEMGHLTETELDGRVREQVEHIVRSVLPWESGRFRKESRPEPLDADLERADISTLNVILDGVRAIDNIESIRRGVGDLDQPLRYAADPQTLDQSLKLTPEEGFLLSRVDGSSSAGEIARLSPLGEEETLRCLWALVVAGLLSTETPTAARKPSEEALRFRDAMLEKHRAASTSTLYELLDVHPGAAPEDIKSSYLRLAKALHPDHRARLGLDGADGAFDELFSAVKSAYDVLSDEAGRRRYDFDLERRARSPGGERPGPPAPESSFSSERTARMHFANGERFFEQGQYHEAIEELRAAIRHDGSRAPYHRLLARALRRNPKWRKQAEEHYQRALALNPFDGQSYVELGELYETLGLATRARKMYEEAAALDPDHRRAVDKLEAEPSASSPIEKIREILQGDRET